VKVIKSKFTVTGVNKSLATAGMIGRGIMIARKAVFKSRPEDKTVNK